MKKKYLAVLFILGIIFNSLSMCFAQNINAVMGWITADIYCLAWFISNLE